MHTKESLLSLLNGFSYKTRVAKLIELGKASVTDEGLTRVLTQLWEGDTYERRMALYSSYGSGDGERVLMALSDPSRLIRNLAYGMVASLCNDAQAKEALLIAHARKKDGALLVALRKRRRFSVIDAFVEQQLQKREPMAADFLAYTSEATFARHLEAAFFAPGELFWQRVLRRYPAQIAGHLTKLLQVSQDGLDARTRSFVTRALPHLAKSAPKETLPLIERLIILGANEWRAHLSPLLQAAPKETFSLLQRQRVNLKQLSFESVALSLSEEQLLFLLKEHRTTLGNPSTWFQAMLKGRPSKEHNEIIQKWLSEHPKVLALWIEGLAKEPLWGEWFFQFLPPDPEEIETRSRSYELWSLARRNPQGIIYAGQLYLLPPDLRAREARRHVTEVSALQTNPRWMIPYCAFLPWEEAREHLRPWLGHPEPEVRAQALGLYLSLLGEQGAINEGLELVKNRRFEPDPVRVAMLGALQSWKPELITEEHHASLSQIIRNALDASDLSSTGAAVIEGLLQKQLSRTPEFVATWLLEILKTRGMLHSARFGEHRDEKELRRMAPSLLRLAAAFRAGKEPLLYQLVQSIGKHLPLVAGIEEHLIVAISSKNPLYINVLFLVSLFRYFRAKFDGVARALANALTRKEWSDLLTELVSACKVDEPHGALLDLAEAQLFDHTQKPAALLLLPILYQKKAERACKLLPTLARRWPLEDWEDLFSALLSKTDAAKTEVAVSLLEDLLQKTQRSSVAETLAGALQKYQPLRFGLLVPKLLSLDPSFGLLPTISLYLDWWRQELLTPYLSYAPIKGRFGGSKPQVFPHQGFYRWSTSQQQLFAKTLDKALKEPEKDVPSLRWALSRRYALAYAPAQTCLELASDERPLVREMAIRALARLDAGQGVVALLECLGDERARFAIYGFRKAILELPPAPAIALLRRTPMQKVTIVKELFRLLGELRSEEAYQLLISLYAPTLHRDARIAHLRALWEHLEREETWDVFGRAAQDPDWIVATKLAEIPSSRLSINAGKKLASLIASLFSRPEPEARRALLQRAPLLPIMDEDRALLKECLRLMGSRYPDESQAASLAVFHRAQGRDIGAVVGRIKELLPLRRPLYLAVTQLISCLQNRSREQQQIAYGALSVLATDPLYAALSIRLAGATQAQQLVSDSVKQLSSKNLLHSDAVLEAHAAIKTLPVEELEIFELSLSAETSPELRRLALAALLQSAQKGWTKSRLRRLAKYQTDESPLVAGAAQLIFTEA